MAKVTIKNSTNAVKSELDEIFDIEFNSYSYKPTQIREIEATVFDMIRIYGSCYLRMQQLIVIIQKLSDLAANVDLPWDPRFKSYSDLLSGKLQSFAKNVMVVYYETQETREALKQNCNAINRLESRKHQLTAQFAPQSSDSVVLLNRIFADPQYKQLAFQVNAGFVNIDHQHERRISRYTATYQDIIDIHRILQEYVAVYKKNPRDLTEAGQNNNIIQMIQLYLPLIDRVRDDIHRLINYIKHEGYSSYLRVQGKYKQSHAIDPEFNRKLDISGISVLEYAILRNNLMTALDRNIEALEQEQSDRELTRDALKNRDFSQMSVSVAQNNNTVTVGLNGMGQDAQTLQAQQQGFQMNPYGGLQGGTMPISPGMMMLDPAFSSLAVNAVAADDILSANKMRLRYEHDNVGACLNRIDSDLKQCVRSLTGIQKRSGERTQEYIDLVKTQKVLEAERQSKRELLKILNDELAEINKENYKLRNREYISEIADEVRVKRDQIRDIQSQLREMTEVLDDNFDISLLDNSDIESEGVASAAHDAAMILRRTTPMDRALTGVQVPSLLHMFGGSKRGKKSQQPKSQQGGGKGGHITITIRDEPDDASPFMRVTPFVIPFLNGAYTRQDLVAKLDGELEDAMMEYNAEIEKQDLSDTVAHQLRETRRVELAEKRLGVLKLFENFGTEALIDLDTWRALGLDSKTAWPGSRRPQITMHNKEGVRHNMWPQGFNERDPTMPLESIPTGIRYCEFQLMHIREYWRSKAYEHIRMTAVRALNLVATQVKQIVMFISKLAEVVQSADPFPGLGDKGDASWKSHPVEGFDAKEICLAIDRICTRIITEGQDELNPYMSSKPCDFWEVHHNPAVSYHPERPAPGGISKPGYLSRQAVAAGFWKKMAASGRGFAEIQAKITNAMTRVYLMTIATKGKDHVESLSDTVSRYFTPFSTKAELVLSQEQEALRNLCNCVIRLEDLSPPAGAKDGEAAKDGRRAELPKHKYHLRNITAKDRIAGRRMMAHKWEEHRFYYRVAVESADLNLEYITYLCSILNRVPTDKAIAAIIHMNKSGNVPNYFDALFPFRA